LEDVGIPRLTPEQVEKLCEIAEKAAREHVLSKVPLSRIIDLDVTVDITGSKPITVDVDVGITLSPLIKNYDVQQLAIGAKDEAFSAVEKYLREITCKSRK
jgi:hypothetical protein